MGQYILCNAVAQTPYCVKPLGRRLFTAEELCYYINHQYMLIEDDFICESLLLFLERDLKMPESARIIRQKYPQSMDLQSALVLLMETVGYYTESEIFEFKDRFIRFRSLSRADQKKQRADALLESGCIEGAIREYSAVVSMPRDTRLSRYFYAQVLQHMGAAYMRLGYSAEALECLQAAYKEQQEPLILKQMYFLAMETDSPYSPELESLDVDALTKWQEEFYESQNKHFAEIQMESDQAVFYEKPVEREKLIQRQIERDKRRYRSMIGEQNP